MKTKKLFAYIGMACMLITSCGPNAQQQAAVKQSIADSVTKSVTTTIETKRAMQDSLNAVNTQREAEQAVAAQACDDNRAALSKAQADLKVANEKLVDIKTFHIGRLESTKEAEVKNQIYVIQGLEDNIKSLEKLLSNCK